MYIKTEMLKTAYELLYLGCQRIRFRMVFCLQVRVAPWVGLSVIYACFIRFFHIFQVPYEFLQSGHLIGLLLLFLLLSLPIILVQNPLLLLLVVEFNFWFIFSFFFRLRLFFVFVCSRYLLRRRLLFFYFFLSGHLRNRLFFFFF